MLIVLGVANMNTNYPKKFNKGVHVLLHLGTIRSASTQRVGEPEFMRKWRMVGMGEYQGRSDNDFRNVIFLMCG